MRTDDQREQLPVHQARRWWVPATVTRCNADANMTVLEAQIGLQLEADLAVLPATAFLQSWF